ncbi:MAG: ethanolamine utilization protein EutJ [Proteobacteria bacterium]|nr:MAG: ethanolamine utilization protein EutJ [Pseudomonadota bacterium]
MDAVKEKAHTDRQAHIQLINRRLDAVAAMLNDDSYQPCEGLFKVGVDLGTADIQTIVLDADDNPIACYMDWADVVRDGVVVDYFGAAQIVREQLRRASERLEITIEKAATSFPPGTEPQISANVVEAAGIEVCDLIDEPSSVARLLELQQGAVVDVGGGTTGTAIIKGGQVVASEDDPTGGRHITLSLAGHFKVPYEEAEEIKLNHPGRDVLSLVAPVILRMADLVKEHIAGHSPREIYLTGGCCALPNFAPIFTAELTGVDIIMPSQPLHLTPLAIAAAYGRTAYGKASFEKTSFEKTSTMHSGQYR